MQATAENLERHYFVDEAGDLTLFNRRGKAIIGTEGCSNYFILGTALIENPHKVRKKIEALRSEILADPYLAKIPSLKKIRSAFHATDDCPEVKMRVFKLINSFPIRVYAIVRRKKILVEYVAKNNQFDSAWRYDGNKVYDACVKRLFKDRLHSTPVNHVTFARRGKSARNQALENSLLKGRVNFEKSSGQVVNTTHRVASNYPSHEPCLQIIDYFLWTLQRLYERHEDRYFTFVQGKFQRIIDLDNRRIKNYGVYYDERNPLTVDKIKDSLKG